MAAQRTTPDSLAVFSDGVFAVIITIMVLDLRPPPQATLAALFGQNGKYQTGFGQRPVEICK